MKTVPLAVIEMEGLFDFEQDGAYPLRRIPMIIRFNLDVCGIRISLAGWVLLNREERESLVVLPCRTAAEQQAYRERFASLLAPHADNPDAVVEFVEVETAPVWRNTDEVPHAVTTSLAEQALPSPALEQWQSLNELQRFALTKLTRPGHKNANLLPALKEFGLA